MKKVVNKFENKYINKNLCKLERVGKSECQQKHSTETKVKSEKYFSKNNNDEYFFY
jgi:hypothetical protein